MSIDLNKYHVEAIITNKNFNKQKIKLPVSRQSLNKALIMLDIVDEDNLTIDYFDKKMSTVENIKKLDEFKINSPTNIYYLNEYLSILKEKKLPLKAKMTVDTTILKKEIAKLLNVENEDMTIREIHNIRNSKPSSSNEKNIEEEGVVEENNKKPEVEKEVKEKTAEEMNVKEKPMFRIADILKRQREGKSKNGK